MCAKKLKINIVKPMNKLWDSLKLLTVKILISTRRLLRALALLEQLWRDGSLGKSGVSDSTAANPINTGWLQQRSTLFKQKDSRMPWISMGHERRCLFRGEFQTRNTFRYSHDVIHANAIRRVDGRIIPTTERCLYACILTFSPRYNGTRLFMWNSAPGL